MQQPKSPGQIIILNGTSSAGKTSIAKALQDVMDEVYIETGLDRFIWMMPSRYLRLPLWNDVLGHATHAGEAGHHMVSGMHHAIAGLSRSGMNVVADHVMVEPAWVQECAELFSELPALFVGVRCELETLEQREKDRKDRTLGQAKAQYDLVHAHTVYDLEVDTANNSTEACVQQIVDYLQSNQPISAFKKLNNHSNE
ncbi:MAG: chloramphenicol phosphotransferase [Pseudomonadota bacterium]